MIEVKEAINRAIDNVQAIYDKERLVGLDLEEVEHNDQDHEWLITLGFWVPDDDPSTPRKFHGVFASNEAIKSMLEAAGAKEIPEKRYVRKYKTVGINSNTGKFNRMRMREL